MKYQGDLTISQAMVELNCGRSTIWSLINCKQLDAYRLGASRSGHARITRESIERLRQVRRIEPGNAKVKA